jgi:N-acetylglutamate synthase-like GNAT family acetyltransferase
MARRDPYFSRKVVSLSQSDIKRYFEVVGVIEESLKKGLPSLYDEFTNVPLTLACLDNGSTVRGGVIRGYDRKNNLATVRFIGVTPGFQGDGIGTKLLTALEEDAKKTGLSGVMAETGKNRASWYERQGYKIDNASSDRALFLVKRF